jgi:GntR family transcriptional regulator/MocR family aminotransferase
MTRFRTSSAGELLVALDRDAAEPLHRQLEQELRTAIRAGRLEAEIALPSTRTLSEQLGISRGVVVEAYEQLVAEGYLTSQGGGATRVSPRVTDAAPAPAASRVAPSTPRIDLSYGRPDVREFPRQAWLRSLRRVLATTPSERLSYLDRRGAPELREALAAYLNRVRGTAATPDRIVITNGFAQALRLLTELVRSRGGRRIGVENPGQRDAVRAARDSGLEVAGIPVDAHGILIEPLLEADPDAVILTPAHQFPTGAVLAADRRAALVDWARARNRLVVEDDYDAEYRYDREPIGAIQGLAPDHVAYAGSASKTLAPGLRVGWLILPDAFVDEVAALKETIDRGSPSLEQLALADFLAHGDFDRHLRRMRPIYRARRDTLLRSIRRHLPDAEPVGASAGLHVLAWLPDDVDDAAVVARVRRDGVAAEHVSQYYGVEDEGGATSRPRSGLLFGYGTVAERAIDEGVRLIAAAI